jgi:hypothetical protein
MDVLCKRRHGQIRIYISCYTSKPVVTAASQVSPFREHGIHYIQANIVYRVDADQCDFFGTLLDLSSRGKPCICTAPGQAMFVPSFSNNRHNRCTAACFRELCGCSPGSLSKAASRFVSISCILRIGHVSEKNKATDLFAKLFKYSEATIAIFEDNLFHGFALFENMYFLKMKNCCRRRPMLRRPIMTSIGSGRELLHDVHRCWGGTCFMTFIGSGRDLLHDVHTTFIGSGRDLLHDVHRFWTGLAS